MPNRVSNLDSVSSVGRRNGESCRFVGAMTQPSGIPRASVSSERLVPCFAPVYRRFSGGLATAGGFEDAPLDRDVLKVEADDPVVGLQADLFECLEQSGVDPLIAAAPDRGR